MFPWPILSPTVSWLLPSSFNWTALTKATSGLHVDKYYEYKYNTNTMNTNTIQILWILCQSSSYLTFQQLLITLTTPSLLKYSFNWLPRHNALLVFLLFLWPLLLAITFADILYFTWPLNIRVPQGSVPAPLFFSLYGFFTPWIQTYTNTQMNLEVIFLD